MKIGLRKLIVTHPAGGPITDTKIQKYLEYKKKFLDNHAI